ncbi:MAG: energy-coupling factor ABC transporter ATP-binding protein [Kiritimatiellaeota bacterium]|nr:energy-coupling factor ABC transporter ATP-binding protein [Kiritimatiellota bacterium]
MNVVEVEGLTCHFACGRRALDNVTFTVAAGERVGLLGANGAGKSTLLLHLNGLLPGRRSRTTGEIRIFGERLERVTLARARRRVGLLFQDPDDQLFCATVFEDVAFGPRQFEKDGARVRGIVENALARAGASDLVGRPPSELSGGEKRRVALAGVLACEPGVLLLDEPTSDLDPRGRREWLPLLAGLPYAQIVASHDLEFVLGLCPRVLVMSAGRVVADGPARHVMRDERLMLEHGLEVPASLRAGVPGG